MKIRLDYVTNSSSSSYIVALKDTKNQDEVEKINNILAQWARDFIFNGDKIKTIEELDEFVKHENWWDIDDKDDIGYKNYIKAKELIKNGYTIYKSYLVWQNIEDDLISSYHDLFKTLNKENSLVEIDTSFEN